MFRYYVKLGFISIRRNPILSALMVAAIATGIGACMTIVNIDYVMSGNPIPHKSDVLFHVQLDNWDPYQAAVEPDLPPRQVSHRDGMALLDARRAERQVLSFRSTRVVEPPDGDQAAFMVSARSTSADFFAMFDTPFLFGSGWDTAADESHEYVTVIGREINDRLFGGENSVGRIVVMNGDRYRVSGVLDSWDPLPRFYDVNNQQFGDVEDVFIPVKLSVRNEFGSSGNTNCWKPIVGNGYAAFLESECVWLQLWVELHGTQAKAAYQQFLDNYTNSQRELGRFARPNNNRLSNVMEWMQIEEVVAEDVRVLLGLAVLFLLVCLLNTIGLLLAKILRRTGDISLRRALGASRRAIFLQYIIEAGVIGLAGGLLGIAMTWLGLQAIKNLFSGVGFVHKLVSMDWVMILAAVLLAIVSALGAALYPTWRACDVAPAEQLKAL